MPYEIKTNEFHETIVEWLQINVGNLLWSRPIVEWKGRGWTMNSMGSMPKPYDGTYRYLIRIDDPKLAVLAAMRFS